MENENNLLLNDLKNSKFRLEGIIEGTNVGTWEWNIQTGETIFNKRWAEIIGYTLEELSPISISTWEKLAHPDDLKKSEELLQDHFNKKTSLYEFESRMKHKNGDWVWILDRGKVTSWTEDGKPLMMMGTHQDITKRKQTEEELKKSEEKFRTLADATWEGIIIHKEGNILYANKAITKITGYTIKELIGKNFIKLIAPDSIESVLQKIQDGINTHIEDLYLEVNCVKKDGNIYYVEVMGRPIIFENINARVLSIRDTTERRASRILLDENEKKYKLLFDNAGDAIFIHDTKGKILEVNSLVSKRLGYTYTELISMSLNQIDSPTESKFISERMSKLIEQGHLTFETIHQCKDGSLIPIEANMKLIMWNSQPAIISICRDITERKQAEKEKKILQEQLIHTNKMEAIGTLAGGIAHDFNNLLMGIQGCTSMILVKKNHNDQDYERLTQIEEQIQRGANLTKQLLGFARGGKYDFKPTNVNKIIKNSLDLFSRTKKDIIIKTNLRNNILPVNADYGQIEQVLINLFVNAGHAMPAGGTLTVNTCNCTERRHDRNELLEPGKYVKLSIIDNGIGMDGKTITKIFDPFFTTKEMGRGTGLGLASAYGIIQSHKGIIDVTSKIGEGTTFDIFLPISDKIIDENEIISTTILTGSETILVIDDEDMIRKMCVEVLQYLGYTVFSTNDGQKGIDIFTENKDKISLVILDMIMPKISGSETFDKLKLINPNIKVILSSGYSINGDATHIMNRGCNGFLQKPYDMKTLSIKIREILEK